MYFKRGVIMAGDMRLSNSSKKRIMDGINSRLNKEKDSFTKRVQENASPDVLYNMVKQFSKNLASDCDKYSSYNDQDLNEFFQEKLGLMNNYLKFVFQLSPNIFVSEVDKWINDISKLYEVCSGRFNKNALDKDKMVELKEKMLLFKKYISSFDTEDMRINSVIDKKIEMSYMFMKSIDDGIKTVEASKLNTGKGTSKNSLADAKALVRLYIANLDKGRVDLVKLNPQMKIYIDSSLQFLNSLLTNNDEKVIMASLEYIKNEFASKINYDIANNKLIVDKDKGIKDVPKGTGNRPSSVNKDDDVKYVALLNTIGNYLKDFNENETLINSNYTSSKGRNDGIEKIMMYRDKISLLMDEVSKRSRNIDDLDKQFKNLVTTIENDLGYKYGANNKNKRRKVIGVRHLGLKIGGFALGAFGFASLIQEGIFYAKFGFLYSSVTPFLLPTALSIISVLMLKKAFSSDDKNVISKVFDRIKSKAKEFLNSDDNELDSSNSRKRR